MITNPTNHFCNEHVYGLVISPLPSAHHVLLTKYRVSRKPVDGHRMYTLGDDEEGAYQYEVNTDLEKKIILNFLKNTYVRYVNTWYEKNNANKFTFNY